MAEQRKYHRWRDVRAAAVEAGKVDETKVAQARRQQLEAQRTYRLAELRKERGPRQADLAKLMGVTQAAVSKLERGDLSHTQLGTLAAYVDALGGRLRVVAEIGDEDITLADDEARTPVAR